MFWLIAKPSTWFLPKFKRELALKHRDFQSQHTLFCIWFRQIREEAETLPRKIIKRQFLWSWRWKSRLLTFVGTIKKRTKRAFHPVFWRKQMKEQFNTYLTMQTISLCCPLLQRKTSVSTSCPLCLPKKVRRGYWKRRNKRILQPGKRWCGQSWWNVQLVRHGKKNKTIGQWGSFIEWLTALSWTHLLFSLKMSTTLENIRKGSDKNSWRNWPLLWSSHMLVRDSKCSKQSKM